MKQCQTCGEKIPDKATICPRCQQRQSYMGPSGLPSGTDLSGGTTGNTGTAIVGIVALALVGAGAGFYFVGQGTAPAPLAQASSPSTAGAQELFPSDAPPPPSQPEVLPPPPVMVPPGMGADEPAAPTTPPGTCTPETRTARFAAVVQKRLGRPADFETVRTTVAPVNGDKVTIILSYHASTAAGSQRTGVAIGKVNVSDCAVTIDLVT